MSDGLNGLLRSVMRGVCVCSGRSVPGVTRVNSGDGSHGQRLCRMPGLSENAGSWEHDTQPLSLASPIVCVTLCVLQLCLECLDTCTRP